MRVFPTVYLLIWHSVVKVTSIDRQRISLSEFSFSALIFRKISRRQVSIWPSSGWPRARSKSIRTPDQISLQPSCLPCPLVPFLPSIAVGRLPFPVRAAISKFLAPSIKASRVADFVNFSHNRSYNSHLRIMPRTLNHHCPRAQRRKQLRSFRYCASNNPTDLNTTTTTQ